VNFALARALRSSLSAFDLLFLDFFLFLLSLFPLPELGFRFRPLRLPDRPPPDPLDEDDSEVDSEYEESDVDSEYEESDVDSSDDEDELDDVDTARFLVFLADFGGTLLGLGLPF
jgi:hypothetical protein